MLTYVFKEQGTPLYEQVYRFVKNDILSGVLSPGEKLPSKRTFAENNGISTIVIQNAYDQLISEGYVYTIPKRGYYVADIANLGRISMMTPAAQFFPDIRIPSDENHADVDLSSNKTDPERFPFSVWARLLREVISEKSTELLRVPPTGGIYELRSAIAEHLKSFRSMFVDPNQIIVGAGTEYLYSLLIQLLGRDKKYCMENPGYSKLSFIYKQYGAECVYASLDEKGIVPAELESSGADIAHISPNHHFPTGITMPAERRYELLAWANGKTGRYVIEDDYDSEFRPNGKPLPTLFSIDACEKVIYMNTFSKSLTPTIRISYMVLPAHLVNKFYKELSFYACTVSNFEQYTLAAFMKQGYFEKHINRMRLHYIRQRKRLIDSMEHSPLRDICEIKENDSGLHFLIHLETCHSDQEIEERLLKQGIRLKTLSDYCLTDSGEQSGDMISAPRSAGASDRYLKEHYFILNYSNIDVSGLDEVWQKIYEAAQA